MSSIHYKFSASSTFKTVVFNGISISLSDLKREIMEKEGLKSTEVDLSISNAQTSETFKNDSEMISKNSSVVVLRTPLSRKMGAAATTAYPVNIPKKAQNRPTVEQLKTVSDLVNVDADEEDKIMAMMHQAGAGYDKYHTKSRYNQKPVPAPSYLRCYKCQGQGHYPSNCTMPKNTEKLARPPTGIPRSKLKPASKDEKGAKLCTDGRYMVVSTESEAYKNPKKERPPFVPVEKKEDSDEEVIPDELCCGICEELVREPVKTPCCHLSYCRDCISKELLNAEEQKCLRCKNSLTPYQLIEDKILKQDAINFKNATEYSRKNARDTYARPTSHQQNPPKKVTYGNSTGEYGSVLGSNGKIEMNKNAGYIVKTTAQIIKVEDQEVKEEVKAAVSLPPPIMPPKIPTVTPPMMSIPPPNLPPTGPPPGIPPSVPPPNIQPPNPSVPPPMPPAGVPAPQLPPPIAPLSMQPPTAPVPPTSAPSNNAPPGPPPMIPPMIPPFMGMPGFHGMPPGMLPNMPSMPGMHQGMPPMPGFMYGPPPNMTRNDNDTRSSSSRYRRSRSGSRDRRRRRRSRDRRSRSRNRRSRSRDRRSRSRDRRDRSHTPKSSKSRDKKSKDKRSKSRDKRSRSKDRRSKSREKRSKSKERRSKSKDRRSQSKDRRSKSKDRRSKSKDRRSKSKDRRSKSKDRRSKSRDRRSISKEKRSKSNERRPRSIDKKERNSDESVEPKSTSAEKARSKSREKSPETRERTPERKKKKRDDRSRSRSTERRRRYSSDDEKKSKKEKKMRKKSRDEDDRKSRKKESKKHRDRRRSRSNDEDRRKRKRESDETKEDSKRRSLGPITVKLDEKENIVAREATVEITIQQNGDTHQKEHNNTVDDVHENRDMSIEKEIPIEVKETSIEDVSPSNVEEILYPVAADNIMINEDLEDEEVEMEPEIETKKERVVFETDHEFSSSKWKPVEKAISNSSGKSVVSSKTESEKQQDMDMDMDDLKNDELEIDIEEDKALISGLPDLRTVISRTSSISDIESDDYQIKPKIKKSRETKKKKKMDRHVRTISHDKHRTRDDSRSRTKKEKKEKKSKKSKKSKRSVDTDSSSPDRDRKKNSKIFL